MDLTYMITQLKVQGQACVSLAGGLTDEAVHWKPSPTSWSVLEVINHLVDEEIYDFRTHLVHILNTPNHPWPEIDPQGWVTQKGYNQQNFEKTLMVFNDERKTSIAMLNKLSEPNWDAYVEFPWGKLTAGDMLASWVAHDLLHLRQLIELRYQSTAHVSQPYAIEYAGQW